MKDDRSFDHGKGAPSPHIFIPRFCKRSAVVEANITRMVRLRHYPGAGMEHPKSLSIPYRCLWGDQLWSILEWPLVQWHMERGPRAKGYTVERTPGNRDGSSHLGALLGRQKDYGSL
jgi:hypothetical protein